MSDYDMNFAKKLLSDEDFDTIFGAEEDDRLMSALKEEADEFIKDDPDTDGVEDGLGDLGKGTGLGSDLGTDHETKGAAGAKDDTSDEDVLAKQAGETFSKGDQLNTGDNAQGQIKDGSQVSGDLHVAGDNADPVDKTFEQAFEEAYQALMEEVNEELGEDPDGGAEMPPVQADVAAPAPAEVAPDTDPVEPEEPEDNPNATVNYTDMLLDDEDDEEDAIFDDCGSACNKPAGQPQAPMVQEEGDVAREERDPGKVEDGKGSENLGDDLGPNHDGNGVSKPADDTSDEDIIAAVGGETLKKDQLNSGDNAQGQVKDGSQVSGDLRVAGDDDKSSDDSFKEAAEDLEKDEQVEDDMIDAANSASDDGEASDDVVNSLIKDEDGDEEDILDLL